MEEQKPVSPEESYDFDGPGSSYEKNPWLDRIIGREAFYLGAKKGDKSEDMKKDGEARCFVIRRPQYANIYGGVQFWMQVGLRDDLSVIGVPFYSCARLNEGWTYMNKKNKSVIGIKNGPTKKCPLARLVKSHPHLIAPLKFKGIVQTWPDGGLKRDYKKLFALEIFEVLFEFTDVPDPEAPGKTKRVVVVDQNTKKPKYTIDPRPYIWELNEPWWEQLRAKVLAPNFAKAVESQVADIDGEHPAKPAKKLPATEPDGRTNPSKIVLKLYAKTDEKDPSRAAYLVDFSPSMVVDSAAIQVQDPFPALENGNIDWNVLYPPMTQEKADEIVDRAAADGGEGMPEPTPAAAGQPSSAPASSPAPAPAAAQFDDDIPF